MSPLHQFRWNKTCSIYVFRITYDESYCIENWFTIKCCPDSLSLIQTHVVFVSLAGKEPSTTTKLVFMLP